MNPIEKALAELLALEADGKHADECSIEAWERARSALSGYQPTEGEKLWLWKNGDHFLAFRHLYPCFEPGGDPMTLGEPVGYAVFKGSHDRSESRPSNPPVAAPHFMSEAAVQQRATQREHARIDGMVGALKRIQEERKGESE